MSSDLLDHSGDPESGTPIPATGISRIRSPSGNRETFPTSLSEMLDTESAQLSTPWRVLCTLAARYPGLWKHAEPAQAISHPDSGLYCLEGDAALASTLASWSLLTKAYEFAPDFLRKFGNEGTTVNLSGQDVSCLPQYSIYIVTPGIECSPGLPMAGFFARLDYAPDSQTEPQPPLLRFDVLIDARKADPSLLHYLKALDPRICSLEVSEVEARDRCLTAESFLGEEPIFVHFHITARLDNETLKTSDEVWQSEARCLNFLEYAAGLDAGQGKCSEDLPRLREPTTSEDQRSDAGLLRDLKLRLARRFSCLVTNQSGICDMGKLSALKILTRRFEWEARDIEQWDVAPGS